jgi:hypothetical protein
MRDTRPAHAISLDVIILIVPVEQYQWWDSSYALWVGTDCDLTIQYASLRVCAYSYIVPRSLCLAMSPAMKSNISPEEGGNMLLRTVSIYLRVLDVQPRTTISSRITSKMTAFWDIAPSSLAEADRRFGSAYVYIIRTIEELRTSETSVSFNKITRRYIPEGYHFYTRRRENLKSHKNNFT